MIFKLFVVGTLYLISPSIFAQILNKEEIILAAKEDVKLFKLDNEQLKIFKKNKENFNSDLFKPNSTQVSNILYLSDSTYVSKFRQLAYIKTTKRRSAGHYALIVGGSVGVLLGVLFLSFVIAFSG